jgi:hypothetical protein
MIEQAFYNQLKFLVLVVSSFIKQDPGWPVEVFDALPSRCKVSHFNINFAHPDDKSRIFYGDHKRSKWTARFCFQNLDIELNNFL